MAKSRKRKKAASQIAKQKVPQPRSISTVTRPLPRGRWAARFIAGPLAIAAAITGLVTFADWALDQYLQTFPEVAPDYAASASSPYLLFSITNRSKYFDITGAAFDCMLPSQTFTGTRTLVLEGGNIDPGFSSKDTNITIPAHASVTFACDPALEPVSPMVAGEILHNTSAKLRIRMTYNIPLLFFNKSVRYLSPMFYCSRSSVGLRCTQGPEIPVELPPNPRP